MLFRSDEVQVSVAHQALSPSPAAVTGVTVQYSVNDGATWQPAAVSGSGATRDAWLDAPPGSYVSLRVSATDAAGSALTETITRAFATETEVAAARARQAPAVAVANGARRAPAVLDDAFVSPVYRPACGPAGPTQAQCFVLYSPEPATGASGPSAAGAGDRKSVV